MSDGLAALTVAVWLSGAVIVTASRSPMNKLSLHLPVTVIMCGPNRSSEFNAAVSRELSGLTTRAIHRNSRR